MIAVSLVASYARVGKHNWIIHVVLVNINMFYAINFAFYTTGITTGVLETLNYNQWSTATVA